MTKEKLSFWQKNLQKTTKLFEKIGIASSNWSDADLEQCEEALILADCGLNVSKEIIKKIRYDREHKTSLKELLLEQVLQKLQPLQNNNIEKIINSSDNPQVILIAGVNGAGKTTTIAKITKYFLSKNKSIVLAAADTFRAAAREQLQHWGEHQAVRVISQQTTDPSAVCFDTIHSAIAQNNDIAIIDTAGRLPTQKNLMAELSKIHKVCNKAKHGAPNECWLILDGSSGQNTITQVEAFNQAIPITGIIISKLDGSSKGGFLLALAQKHPKIPIVFVGVGEKPEDLREFSAKEYATSLINYA